MQDIEKDIKSLVSRIIKVPENKLDPNADLFKDLGVDSLLGIEIFASLDKKFKINIPEEQLSRIKSLNDIIGIVKNGVLEKK